MLGWFHIYQLRKRKCISIEYQLEIQPWDVGYSCRFGTHYIDNMNNISMNIMRVTISVTSDMAELILCILAAKGNMLKSS